MSKLSCNPAHASAHRTRRNAPPPGFRRKVVEREVNFSPEAPEVHLVDGRGLDIAEDRTIRTRTTLEIGGVWPQAPGGAAPRRERQNYVYLGGERVRLRGYKTWGKL